MLYRGIKTSLRGNIKTTSLPLRLLPPSPPSRLRLFRPSDLFMHRFATKTRASSTVKQFGLQIAEAPVNEITLPEEKVRYVTLRYITLRNVLSLLLFVLCFALYGNFTVRQASCYLQECFFFLFSPVSCFCIFFYSASSGFIFEPIFARVRTYVVPRIRLC